MADYPSRKGIPVYTVDAFTDEPFRGNPAAVCLLPRGLNLSTETLQIIAAEINLTETAYVEPLTDYGNFEKANEFNLRWFTPTDEIELCGHATLASASVLFFACGNVSSEITFNSTGGKLIAKRNGDMITLNFPLNPSQKMDRSEIEELLKALCSEDLIKDVEYSASTKKLLVRIHDGISRSEFEGIVPDYKALEESDKSGRILEVIFTMVGSKDITDKNGKPYDFVSRNFSPWVGIPEDPVTGSAHTVLADYWRRQLGISKFYGNIFRTNRLKLKKSEMRRNRCDQSPHMATETTITLHKMTYYAKCQKPEHLHYF